jgi:crotonobetainyl-CoA:carnitine CoA-transferase CaiB-like acyl-CoA transferase
MQALGGIMSVNGHPGQPPAARAGVIVDMGTGMWAAIAILGALRERDRTGRGVNVTTALYETALAWGVFQMSQFLGTAKFRCLRARVRR